MIPLMRNAFLREQETKEKLSEFILRAGRLSMGAECAKFEREFAAFQGTKEAILFNSGSSANLAMIQASKNLGILRDGDRIGFSALTWATNVMPIIQLGLQPVPIDCEPATLNIMSHQLNERLEQMDLQGLFVTNVLGLTGDLNVIRQICDKNNIFFIEDNCEALGTELKAGKAGNFGAMASFSFYISHHISTIEGGMVCTNDKKLAEMLRIVRAFGWDRNLDIDQQRRWRKKYNILSEFQAKYTFYDLGYNFRPTEITGFLGRYQLRFLKETIETRQKNYLAIEAAVRYSPDLVTLDRSHISVISSFALPILCRTPGIREEHLARFADTDIEVRPIIAGNIQRQPFYKKYISKSYSLPGANKVHKCGFYCGNYPELTETDIRAICRCLTVEKT